MCQGLKDIYNSVREELFRLNVLLKLQLNELLMEHKSITAATCLKNP